MGDTHQELVGIARVVLIVQMHELSRFTTPPGDVHCMGGDSSCDRNLNKKPMMAVLELISQGDSVVGANTLHHRPSTPTKCLEELLQDRQIDPWGQHRCSNMANVTLRFYGKPFGWFVWVCLFWVVFVCLFVCLCLFCFGWLPTMSRWRSFLPDLMTVRAVMVRAWLKFYPEHKRK